MKDTFLRSFAARETFHEPYPHWFLHSMLPEAAVDQLSTLDFPVADLHGESGRREIHNATRQYFDQENIARFPVVAEFAALFQSDDVVEMFASALNADLSGTYLRIEYAQDTDGFWLQPHTDIGVKHFTMLYYLAEDETQMGLGTDIYSDNETHWGSTPFERNLGFVFIPSNKTWHGFEKRPITGVRKSIIVNYVSNEWRAREQLAFPERPVLSAVPAL